MGPCDFLPMTSASPSLEGMSFRTKSSTDARCHGALAIARGTPNRERLTSSNRTVRYRKDEVEITKVTCRCSGCSRIPGWMKESVSLLGWGIAEDLFGGGVSVARKHHDSKDDRQIKN